MLGKVPLFSGVDEEELRLVARAGKSVEFERGKTILKEGEPGLTFFLILEGRIEVRKKGKPVARMGPGGFFGEMTVFDDKPRSADVVALEPTRCYGITEWSITPVLKSNPTIAIGVIGELVKRLRQLEDNPSD